MPTSTSSWSTGATLPSGHWNDAYPFVQLHQASLFYGVASTELGSGRVQDAGPESGLHERARRAEIQAYYDDVLHRRFLGSGRVRFLSGCEHRSDGSTQVVTSRVSGETRRGSSPTAGRRRHLSRAERAGDHPAAVRRGRRRLAWCRWTTSADLVDAPSAYVIVGSGKTATDAIVWLVRNGVAPDRIIWIRPRDPWMLNRAFVQPDPAVAFGLAADTMEAAIGAASIDEVFLRLEDGGSMLRIDRGRRAHHGQGPDPRRPGSWSCCGRSSRSSASGTSIT